MSQNVVEVQLVNQVVFFELYMFLLSLDDCAQSGLVFFDRENGRQYESFNSVRLGQTLSHLIRIHELALVIVIVVYLF